MHHTHPFTSYHEGDAAHLKEGEEGVVIWLMNAVVELEVVLEVIVMCKCSSSHKRSIDGRLFSMERSEAEFTTTVPVGHVSVLKQCCNLHSS